MKLSEYLAKHLADEGVLIDDTTATPESGEIELIIQQGIEAFASVDNYIVISRTIDEAGHVQEIFE